MRDYTTLSEQIIFTQARWIFLSTYFIPTFRSFFYLHSPKFVWNLHPHTRTPSAIFLITRKRRTGKEEGAHMNLHASHPLLCYPRIWTGGSIDSHRRSRVNHNLGTAIRRIKLSLFEWESPRSVHRFLTAVPSPSRFLSFALSSPVLLGRAYRHRGLFFRESRSLSEMRWVWSNGPRTPNEEGVPARDPLCSFYDYLSWIGITTGKVRRKQTHRFSLSYHFFRKIRRFVKSKIFRGASQSFGEFLPLEISRPCDDRFSRMIIISKMAVSNVINGNSRVTQFFGRFLFAELSKDGSPDRREGRWRSKGRGFISTRKAG